MRPAILLGLLVATLVVSAGAAGMGVPDAKGDARGEVTQKEAQLSLVADKVVAIESSAHKQPKELGQQKPHQPVERPLVDAAYLMIGDYFRLMLNPAELTKSIATRFQLDFEKLSSLVGKNLLYGPEAALTPLVSTMKLVEKVFVPDSCLLKFTCSLGARLSFIRGHMPSLSGDILAGSQHLKAFSEGILGKQCELTHSACTNNQLTVQKSVQDQASLSVSSRSGSPADQLGAEATRKPLFDLKLGPQTGDLPEKKQQVGPNAAN